VSSVKKSGAVAGISAMPCVGAGQSQAVRQDLFLSAAIGTRLSRKAVGANDALDLIAQLLAE
jgi:hypothetical protein